MTLFIKNMVCNRCKKVISDELNSMGIDIKAIELGRLEVTNDSKEAYERIESVLNKNGFELIKDEETQIVEQLKLMLIQLVENLPIERNEKLSSWLSSRLNMDYSRLSKTFSRKEQVTIEKFFLKLKVEKVKALIQQNQHSFSEIAYLLDYSNSNHLAKQFKSETGMRMSEYKGLKNWERKPLDEII